MKIAASVISWLEWISANIVKYVLLAIGIPTQTNHGQVLTPCPTWGWVLAAISTVIGFIVLCWRQSAVENGNKVGSGVATLLFASFIGGILTLSIPDYELYGTMPSSHTNNTYIAPVIKKKKENALYTKEERDEKVKVNKNLFDKGIITEEEFNQRVAEIDAKTEKIEETNVEKENQTSSEDDTIAAIQKYKKLLDDGAITQEEYEKKKQELLNK